LHPRAAHRSPPPIEIVHAVPAKQEIGTTTAPKGVIDHTAGEHVAAAPTEGCVHFAALPKFHVGTSVSDSEVVIIDHPINARTTTILLPSHRLSPVLVRPHLSKKRDSQNTPKVLQFLRALPDSRHRRLYQYKFQALAEVLRGG
jgi:hypothetical protein